MNNDFNDMNDEEFLYQMCTFMRKESFIRFVNIASNRCYGDDCRDHNFECGECCYKYLGKYERLREGLKEGFQEALSEV